MGIFDGNLIACDVDDTLVSSGYINPRNIEKIKFFVDEGGIFSLASGRSAGALLPVAKALEGCVSSSVTGNGSLIYDFETGKIVAEQTVPREDYRIVKAVAELDKIAVEIHSQLNVLVVKRNSESDLHEEYEKLEPQFVSFERAAEYKWNKIVYILNNLEEREFLKDFISKYNFESQFIESCAFIEGKMHYYYEQLPVGTTKAKGLQNLCDILKIQKGKLFAIGDYYNDVEMLKNADIAAVVKGAPQEVLDCADYVTVPCKDGAVADFIDYLTERFG